MRAMRKRQHIYASAANLLHIRIGNLNCCKCGHCKTEAREIDCLCCRDPTVPGKHLTTSFYGPLPDY